MRGVTIGEGIPKIIVPVTGSTPEQLRAQVTALAGVPADMVEWRADHYRGLDDIHDVVAVARTLTEHLAERPLLFTCRTSAEGGQAAIDDKRYAELNTALIESGTADLVDVEYQRDRAAVDRIIAAARAHGVPVIASHHDFTGTPSKDEIISRLRQMQELGADICKIAVMPHSAADVLTLLDATHTMRQEHADRPLITVAMGGLGLVSRLSGQVFGSAATFAAAGAASAPGQIDVRDVRTVLKLFDQAR